MRSDEDSGGRLPHRVYAHGIGVPFRKEGHDLCYYIYYFGVGFCCFFSLTHKVFLGPQLTRIMNAT